MRCIQREQEREQHTRTKERPILIRTIAKKTGIVLGNEDIIDQEVQRFLTMAQERAVQALSEHRDDLDRLAHALLERESLGQSELKEILGDRSGKTDDNSSDLKLPYPSSVTP